jgi:magnesium-protoporphyrin IX monomethyl ester (oxidative) cyclase
MELAYSFEDEGHPGHVHRGLQGPPGQQKLNAMVEEWNAAWQTSRPVLRVRDEGGRLHVVDTRPCARQRTWTSGALEAEVYRLCDSGQTPASIPRQLSAQRGTEISASEVDAAIETLCRAKVALRVNGRLLGVGVRA